MPAELLQVDQRELPGFGGLADAFVAQVVDVQVLDGSAHVDALPRLLERVFGQRKDPVVGAWQGLQQCDQLRAQRQLARAAVLGLRQIHRARFQVDVVPRRTQGFAPARGGHDLELDEGLIQRDVFIVLLGLRAALGQGVLDEAFLLIDRRAQRSLCPGVAHQFLRPQLDGAQAVFLDGGSQQPLPFARLEAPVTFVEVARAAHAGHRVVVDAVFPDLDRDVANRRQHVDFAVDGGIGHHVQAVADVALDIHRLDLRERLFHPLQAGGRHAHRATGCAGAAGGDYFRRALGVALRQVARQVIEPTLALVALDFVPALVLRPLFFHVAANQVGEGNVVRPGVVAKQARAAFGFDAGDGGLGLGQRVDGELLCLVALLANAHEEGVLELA